MQNLQSLGWTQDLQTAYDQFPDAAALLPARVLRHDRSGLVARTADGLDVDARVPSRLRAEPPTTGDWVALRREADGDHSVAALLPRRTRLARARPGRASAEQVVAANVDVALLVAGLDGDFEPRRLERYLALAHAGGVAPVIVLNKADACDDVAARRAEAERVAGGAPVLVVSAATGAGLDAVRALLRPGLTVALVGSSGVGKSTLVNALAGDARQETGAVRAHDSRGRHTTTRRELVPIEGGALLLDTPGLREVGLLVDEGSVRATFDDVESLARLCRFRDCAHGAEPGCAVRAAVESGDLDPARLSSFDKLRREAAWRAKRSDAAAMRRDARGFGKMARSHVAYKRDRLRGE